MCAFSVRCAGSDLDEAVLKRDIDRAIEYYKQENTGNKDRYFFGFSTGGSFFDPGEIPESIRLYFYEHLKNILPEKMPAVLVLESRLEFINEDVLMELRNSLGDNFLVSLGYGLESTDELVREACVNKRLPDNWTEKIELLKAHNILLKAHLMVKPPFLGEEEAVQDVVRSVRQVFDREYAWSVVIMVMSVHKNSAVDILASNGLYSLPSIWSIINIIKALGPEICHRVTLNGLAWNKKQWDTDNQASYPRLVRGCSQCSGILIPKLLNFKEPNSPAEWRDLMEAAAKVSCECKKSYNNRDNTRILSDDMSLRILSGLDKLSLITNNKNLSQLLNEEIYF